ncbi:MAG: hypothetical protein MUQ10_05000, partial [Anaerolineae bacterium]|nr:hypothetical protein [Anaerolineae bacterium]
MRTQIVQDCLSAGCCGIGLLRQPLHAVRDVSTDALFCDPYVALVVHGLNEHRQAACAVAFVLIVVARSLPRLHAVPPPERRQDQAMARVTP